MAGLDLENRPWYWALIIGLVLAGALIWAFENYLFSDIEKEITSSRAQLQTLQQKVREGKVAEGHLAQFREEAERLSTELNTLLRILPTERQNDELIKKIKSLTERGNFRLESFEPRGLAKKEFYSEYPIAVRLEGNYHELALFFDRLSRFSRIINVDALQIAANTQRGPYTISANFTMKTFIYAEGHPGSAAGGTP
jgi:type IV pilus assembly protein PilO